MADAFTPVNGIIRRVAAIDEVASGTFRKVPKIPVPVNGVTREGYVAYTPTTFPGFTVTDFVNDQTPHLLGSEMPMSLFQEALDNGYTRFRCTLFASVEEMNAGEVNIGFGRNGRPNPYGAISYSGGSYGDAMVNVGSYSEPGSIGSETNGVIFNFDVADLISQIGIDGYMRPAYCGNDYVGYTPAVGFTATFSDMYFTRS